MLRPVDARAIVREHCLMMVVRCERLPETIGSFRCGLQTPKVFPKFFSEVSGAFLLSSFDTTLPLNVSLPIGYRGAPKVVRPFENVLLRFSEVLLGGEGSAGK